MIAKENCTSLMTKSASDPMLTLIDKFETDDASQLPPLLQATFKADTEEHRLGRSDFHNEKLSTLYSSDAEVLTASGGNVLVY